MKPSNIFMTCEWKDLIMSSYEIDKKILEPYLPPNTELDLFNGKAILSLVAFTFSKVKFFGIKVPFHQKFGQINFRFYAKSNIDGSKGVVFIKEFAPKWLIALVGNKLYNEPYFYKPIDLEKNFGIDTIRVKYRYNNASIEANVTSKAAKLSKNTLKHFIVDRYIAYIKNSKNKTVRYNIYHKPWLSIETDHVSIDKFFLKLLPPNFKNLNHLSTYLIDGSNVMVQKGIIQ